MNASINDNKTREQELAAATAHYMRTAGDLFRAFDRNQRRGDDPEGYDRAAKADSEALDRLQRVLEQFPKDKVAQLWKDIVAARKKL